MNAKETMEKLRDALEDPMDAFWDMPGTEAHCAVVYETLDEVQIQLIGLEEENIRLKEQLNTARRSL